MCPKMVFNEQSRMRFLPKPNVSSSLSLENHPDHLSKQALKDPLIRNKRVSDENETMVKAPRIDRETIN